MKEDTNLLNLYLSLVNKYTSIFSAIGINMGYYVKIPIFGSHTRVIYFPTCIREKLEKFSLYVKDLTNMEHTGNYILVPYLVGHNYVMLPAKDEGTITVEYSKAEPQCLSYFPYSADIDRPEV